MSTLTMPARDKEWADTARFRLLEDFANHHRSICGLIGVSWGQMLDQTLYIETDMDAENHPLYLGITWTGVAPRPWTVWEAVSLGAIPCTDWKEAIRILRQFNPPGTALLTWQQLAQELLQDLTPRERQRWFQGKSVEAILQCSRLGHPDLPDSGRRGQILTQIQGRANSPKAIYRIWCLVNQLGLDWHEDPGNLGTLEQLRDADEDLETLPMEDWPLGEDLGDGWGEGPGDW